MSEYYLAHHGIKGMRWGVRRFERKDGTLTPAGKRRYDYAPDGNGPAYKIKTPTSARIDGGDRNKRQPGIVRSARSVVSTQSKKPPVGARVDGASKQKMPVGAKVDGFSKTTRKPYTAQQRSNLKRSMKRGFISAGIGAVTLSGGAYLHVTRGKSIASDAIRALGAGMTIGGLAGGIVQAGRLSADNMLRARSESENQNGG